MKRKLFCEISPLTYRISTKKEILMRKIRDLPLRGKFARVKQEELLPVRIKKHASLIRRRLGNVDMQLQENKAVNLSLAAPCIDRVLIRPGEIFSFWTLVGDPSARRGFPGRPGDRRRQDRQRRGRRYVPVHQPDPLDGAAQRPGHHRAHHHDGMDLFPDYGRQIPFGTGTSILYNYLDYRFQNNTDRTYQLTVWTDGEYLHGELLADRPQQYSYHIECRNEFFSREEDGVYRNNEIWRHKIDVHTGEEAEAVLLRLQPRQNCL